jgi:hypothetical protein
LEEGRDGVVRKHTCASGSVVRLIVSACRRISFVFSDTASLEHLLHPDSERDGSEPNEHHEQELDQREGSGWFIFEKHRDGPFC